MASVCRSDPPRWASERSRASLNGLGKGNQTGSLAAAHILQSLSSSPQIGVRGFMVFVVAPPFPEQIGQQKHVQPDYESRSWQPLSLVRICSDFISLARQNVKLVLMWGDEWKQAFFFRRDTSRGKLVDRLIRVGAQLRPAKEPLHWALLQLPRMPCP